METHTFKAVFLSYAREDATAARRIAEALRSNGIEVWFDENELRGGDAWDQKIRRQIRDCTLFLAIISAHTQERGEGYFRLEWNLAVDRTRLMMEGVPFLVPVVVDETRENMDMVPESFGRVQWTRLPSALPTPQFVEQVKRLLEAPRRPVAFAPSTVQPSHLSSADNPAPQTTPALAQRSKVRGWAWRALAAILAIGVAVWFATRQSAPPAAPTKIVAAAAPKPPAPVSSDKAIAVLPFENLSPDKENEFFAGGIREEVLSSLYLIHDLRVISIRESTDASKSPRQFARELGVAHLLEASVRRAGNSAASKVRVTARLLKVGTEEQVWTHTYEEELSDLFAIQSKFAQAIASALQAEISPQGKALFASRPTSSPEAYALYLQARELLRDTKPGTDRRRPAEALLQDAVTRDPNFAAAWSQLTHVLARLHYANRDPASAGQTKAKEAMDHAVRLAPDSPDGIRAIADYDYYCLRDYAQAAVHYMRLVRFQPNDADAVHQLGIVGRRQGRWTEALAHFRQATLLDPGHLVFASNLVVTLSEGRRYADAMREQRRIVGLDPNNLFEVFELALLLFHASGSTKEGEQFFSQLPETQANSNNGVRLRKLWALKTGSLDELKRIDQLNPGVRAAPMYLRARSRYDDAVVLAAKGELAAARAQLEKIPAKLRAQLASEPMNDGLWASLGEVEALLGHKDEALNCARAAVKLLPESLDARDGPQRSASLAFVYAWTGDKDRAIAEYARLLRTPYGRQNIHEMKRDPLYFPLQGAPRFEALLNDPKNNAPLF